MRRLLPALVLVLALGCVPAAEEVCRTIILPEQRSLTYRDPSQLPPATLPASVPPRTVSDPRPDTPEWPLSLDEAIQIALRNTKVVRVLAGVAAANSGRTIYDAAITNTTIDQAQAAFDPIFSDRATFNHLEQPSLGRNGRLTGTPTDNFNNILGLQKTNVLGGTWGLNWTEDLRRFDLGGLVLDDPTTAFLLNPENRRNVELSYNQPLLKGGGFLYNTAPILIARLNTELSFFQFKDSVQEMVRGVVEAYWALVQARVDLWARKIQVQQSQEAYEREKARKDTGFGKAGPLAQARVTYAQFKAAQVAAEANVLQREDALRNLLFLPPDDNRKIVPVSSPASQRLPHDWDKLLQLAQERRPDIVELKIILEADQVRLLQARNQALPQLDARASYRWNGLNGELPNGQSVSSRPGEFTDWTVGVNFSVPLGLRAGRAGVRQQELILARDQANIAQALHAAIHDVAITVRALDSAYDQYQAYKETREAARENLQVQIEQFRIGLGIYLDVLQALDAWGNAVTSEARALLDYNTLLATLERQTGTILETHGLVFFEERYRAAGPLGKHFPEYYPSALVPAGETRRYPDSGKPGEDAFNLENPTPPRSPRDRTREPYDPARPTGDKPASRPGDGLLPLPRPLGDNWLPPLPPPTLSPTPVPVPARP